MSVPYNPPGDAGAAGPRTSPSVTRVSSIYMHPTQGVRELGFLYTDSGPSLVHKGHWRRGNDTNSLLLREDHRSDLPQAKKCRYWSLEISPEVVKPKADERA